MTLMGAGKPGASAPPVAGSTWDTTRAATGYTFSTDLLTATNTSGGYFPTVFSTLNLGPGNWYFEVGCQNPVDSNVDMHPGSVWTGDISIYTNQFIGAGGTSIGYDLRGNIQTGATNVASGPAATVPYVVGTAITINSSAQITSWQTTADGYWNFSSTAVPGVSGGIGPSNPETTTLTVTPGVSSGHNGHVFVWNGAGPFARTIPSGFSAAG